MAAISPKPNLTPGPASTALAKAQTANSRLSALLPTTTTVLSPSTIYQPGTHSGIGGELLEQSTTGPSITGVWVAPDVNGNGSDYTVQVECFGAGGGGGGGSNTIGGGGAGGGGYSCEPNYVVTPGFSYAWVIGPAGTPGVAAVNGNAVQGNAGLTGGTTIFDVGGVSIPGGVQAFGGGGGDINGTAGIGGQGAPASANTIAAAGGQGGQGDGDIDTDNPLLLAQTPGMFAGNTLSASVIEAWWIFNDTPGNYTVNDATGKGKNGTITDFYNYGYNKGWTSPAIPGEVPAFAAGKNVYGPNATLANAYARLMIKNKTTASAKVENGFGYLGSKLTFSGWIQCDPSGTWGNPAGGSFAVIAANCKNYAFSAPPGGYAVYIVNTGTTNNPAWQLYSFFGNGSNYSRLTQSLPATPGQWYYIVATFTNGTHALYVNGTEVSQAAGFSSVSAGAYGTTVGVDPSATANWFFGSISNFWWANDAATSTLVAQVLGGTAPTGGAGGGASGSQGGIGGTGGAASGATGGSGGSPVSVPVNAANTASSGNNGGTGANAGSSRGGIGTQPGAGGGGGGSGENTSMSTANQPVTITIPFTTAATYCGADAIGGNAGALYNPNQQNVPGNTLTSLTAGGQASDPGSGTKNSLLLIPPSALALLKSTSNTIARISLTFVNAFPDNQATSILEIGWSGDKSLSEVYTGSSLAGSLGVAVIEPGAATVTLDVTPSTFVSNLQSGAATALVLGPGDDPTIESYSGATATDYYSKIYGPGSQDNFGNSYAPYLTVTYVPYNASPTFYSYGEQGGGGKIALTLINNIGTPVTTSVAYQVTDANNNVLPAGLTAYTTVSSVLYAVNLNGTGTNGYPGISVSTTSAPPYALPGLFGLGSSTSAVALVTSGQETSGDVASVLTLESATESGVTSGTITAQTGRFQTTGALEVDGTNAPGISSANGILIQPDGNGYPRVTTNSEGAEYHFGHRVYSGNGTFTNSGYTVMVTIPNLIASGGYHIRIYAMFHMAAGSGAADFSFSASGGLSLNVQNGFATVNPGLPPGAVAFSSFNAFSGALVATGGPSLSSTGEQAYYLDAFITVSTPGSLNATCKAATATNVIVDTAYAIVEHF